MKGENMIEIIGNYNTAKCFASTLEDGAREQIKTVCSKGGTTERAVAELERYDFYKAFADAMLKCTERADELGSGK